MTQGDVTLKVVNNEDFDVVRGGFLFPAKGDATVTGETDRTVVTQAHRVREITACRYLTSTLVDVEGDGGNSAGSERVQAFGEAVKSTPGSEDTEVDVPDDERSLAEKNNEANATAGAKELATEYELDLSEVESTNSGGRVDKADVQNHLDQVTSSGSLTEGQAGQAATTAVEDDNADSAEGQEPEDKEQAEGEEGSGDSAKDPSAGGVL